MTKKRAFLLSMEGIEGTGKSTHCRILSRFLKRQGYKVCIFREPGSSSLGEKIREILLHSKNELTAFCETLLFVAAREQLVTQKLKKNLYTKDVIILDRYIDATLAYQGYGAGVDVRLIKQLNKAAVGKLVPDLTILLDVCPKTGISRSGRGDRFEKRNLAFHGKVRNGYLRLAKKDKKRIKVIATDTSIENVEEKIQQIIHNRLGCKNKI